MNRENKQVSYIILSIYDALIFTIGLFSFLFGIVREIKAEKVLDRGSSYLIGEEYMVTCDSLIVVGLILLIISSIIMIAVNKKAKEKNNS